MNALLALDSYTFSQMPVGQILIFYVLCLINRKDSKSPGECFCASGIPLCPLLKLMRFYSLQNGFL